jgi:hypothetical protein
MLRWVRLAESNEGRSGGLNRCVPLVLLSHLGRVDGLLLRRFGLCAQLLHTLSLGRLRILRQEVRALAERSDAIPLRNKRTASASFR